MRTGFDPELDPALKMGVPGHLWLTRDGAGPGECPPEYYGEVCLVHGLCIDCGDVGHFFGWPGEERETLYAAALVGGLPFRCTECRRR